MASTCAQSFYMVRGIKLSKQGLLVHSSFVDFVVMSHARKLKNAAKQAQSFHKSFTSEFFAFYAVGNVVHCVHELIAFGAKFANKRNFRRTIFHVRLYNKPTE